MSAGVPVGATTPNQPFMTTPGTVSLRDGRSGRPGKRCSEVMASRRTLPACTTAFAAAIELIITCVDAARDVLRHLRGGAIGHLDQAEVGAPVEQLGGEGRRARGRVEGDRELAAVGLGVGDELGQRMRPATSAFTDSICGPRLQTIATGVKSRAGS